MPSPLAEPNITLCHASPARVLVADDDSGSRRFLCDGLRSLGATVEACADGVTARTRACAEAFDLLLLDCRMPGAGALQILAALQDDPHAASLHSIAVATTAELAMSARQSLRAAGFSDILIKPCTLADLQRLLALLPSHGNDACVLDDNAALSVSGDATTMRALRLLLCNELVQLSQEIDTLSRNPVRFSERLHRLRSSCGFCGASALAAQSAWLSRQLSSTGEKVAPTALEHFHKTLLATLEALEA